MKKLQNQLKTIMKSLYALSKQVEKAAKEAEKLQPAKAAPQKSAGKKAPPKKTAAPKTAGKKAAAKKAPDKKASAPEKSSVIDTVYGIVARSKNGVSVANLQDKTGLKARQLSNALYKLTKRDKIEAKSRGLYVKK